MRRLVIAVGLAGCHGTEPVAPAPSLTSHAPPASKNVAFVARCATQAVELLGWNPLPDGAHHGMVIKTALEHGASADCAPLATETNTSSFHVGGDVIDWNWEPKDRPEATTIRFQFTCPGCVSAETNVELPRHWHCFGWLEEMHNGTSCHPDHAACEAARARISTTTPCELHTGAAWCQHAAKTTCADSPWSCTDNPVRAPCDRVP